MHGMVRALMEGAKMHSSSAAGGGHEFQIEQYFGGSGGARSVQNTFRPLMRTPRGGAIGKMHSSFVAGGVCDRQNAQFIGGNGG